MSIAASSALGAGIKHTDSDAADTPHPKSAAAAAGNEGESKAAHRRLLRSVRRLRRYCLGRGRSVPRSLARSLSLQNGLVNVRTDISTMGGWVANSLTDTALRTTVDFAES